MVHKFLYIVQHTDLCLQKGQGIPSQLPGHRESTAFNLEGQYGMLIQPGRSMRRENTMNRRANVCSGDVRDPRAASHKACRNTREIPSGKPLWCTDVCTAIWVPSEEEKFSYGAISHITPAAPNTQSCDFHFYVMLSSAFLNDKTPGLKPSGSIPLSLVKLIPK